MYAKNFTYDGETLSSKGYVLCDFGTGDNTRPGSNISFSTVPVDKGQKFLAADAKYENCLTTTLQICKNICNISNQDNLKLTPTEVSALSRWLNKKAFRPMVFDATGWTDIIFEASFNISAIEIGGEIYGLELEMITNRPFATKAQVTKTLTFASASATQTLEDTSDEIGYIYPDEVKITLASAGNLSIATAIEGRTSLFNNCSNGEIITITHPTITTNVSQHAIQNDFNYVFPRVANSSAQRTDTWTASLPCTVEVKYKPIMKVTL